MVKPRQWLLLLSVFILAVGMAQVAAQDDDDGDNPIPDPPPAQTCFWSKFHAGSPIRIGPGVFKDQIFCRTLVEKGDYIWWYGSAITGAGNVGDRTVLDFGIDHAVDIQSGLDYWENGVVMCLRGRGRLLFSQRELVDGQRVWTDLPRYRVNEWPGYACTTLFYPGLMVMTTEQMPALPPPPKPVENCTVTTLYRVNLRRDPNTSSDVLQTVPPQTQLQPIGRAGNWYLVPPPDGGDSVWVAYLNGRQQLLELEGDCGQVCTQNAAGTTLSCRLD